MSIADYKQCLSPSDEVPYYNEPQNDSEFPSKERNSEIPAKKTSVLPILITAHRKGINVQDYHFISERTSFRKIAMDNEDYVIGVKRFGKTIFLRRYDDRATDMSDEGHRFERMCIPNYKHDSAFHLMVEGQFDTLRTLIAAQTDAIDENTGDALELKSRLNGTDIARPADCWLQSFLSKFTNLADE